MNRGAAPFHVRGPGTFLSGEGTLAGQTIVWQPVLGTATYPSCWQAWRTTVEPSTKPCSWGLKITNKFFNDVELKWKGHFLPN
jgi:hypothetical protein